MGFKYGYGGSSLMVSSRKRIIVVVPIVIGIIIFTLWLWRRISGQGQVNVLKIAGSHGSVQRPVNVKTKLSAAKTTSLYHRAK